MCVLKQNYIFQPLKAHGVQLLHNPTGLGNVLRQMSINSPQTLVSTDWSPPPPPPLSMAWCTLERHQPESKAPKSSRRTVSWPRSYFGVSWPDYDCGGFCTLIPSAKVISCLQKASLTPFITSAFSRSKASESQQVIPGYTYYCCSPTGLV